MNLLSSADVEFRQRFAAGKVPPQDFSHKAHLRLAYVHLVANGPDRAVATFRSDLQRFLRIHKIDPAKFHETLTQSWLRAVWHFMQRAGDTSGGDDFLKRSTPLHDPKAMLTHYSKNVLFSMEARRQFIEPDLDPIPRGATPSARRAT
jgi:hypothetical protein